MSPSKLFSSTNHFRHSHYLQALPENPSQPTSFGRSSGATLKNSLRKIPSSLFGTGEGIKDEQFLEKRSEEPVKTKPKTRTRKVFGDILNWGNTAKSAPAPPKVSAPQPLRASTAPQPLRPAATSNLPAPSNIATPLPTLAIPPVPAKEPRAVLRKPSTNRIKAKPSLSLRTSDASATDSIRRPSMGPDPFQRRAEGAEVVEHITIHGVKRTSEGTGSVSSTAFSPRSDTTEEQSVSPIGARTSTQTHLTIPSSIEDSSPQKRHASAPLPSKALLVDPPPRSASLGRVLDKSTEARAPAPAAGPATTARPEAPISIGTTSVNSETRTIKKEKTKSRVWGMLVRGKSKKAKSDVQTVPVVHETNDQVAVCPQLFVKAGPKGFDDHGWPLSPDIEVKPVAKRSTRIRPPVLHLAQSSIDHPALIAPLTASTFASPPSTARTSSSATARDSSHHAEIGPLSACSHGTFGKMQEQAGNRDDRISEGGSRSTTAPARKGVPKRKSLSGLFGLALKTSFEKAKVSSAATAGSMNPFPITWGADVKPTQPKKLSAVPEEEAKLRGSTVTQHTISPPYFSRFGERLEPFGRDASDAEADLHLVSTATDQLSTLLSSFDFSPGSSTPASADCSRTLTNAASLTSLKNNANNSPTPMRRIQSAMLSVKPGTSPVKAGRTRISPLKFALRRAHLAADGPGIPRPTLRSGTFNKPNNSLVKDGARNGFAPLSPKPPHLGSAIGTVMHGVSSLKGHTRPTVAELTEIHSDIPDDLLQAIIFSSGGVAGNPVLPMSGHQAPLGLPSAPPPGRISPRRRPLQPPTISLPPSPDVPLQYTSNSSIEPLPRLAFEFSLDEGVRDSVFSDMLSPVTNELRDSFDFTSEYAKLDRGDHRASFIKALQRMGSSEMLTDPDKPDICSAGMPDVAVSGGSVPTLEADGADLDAVNEVDSESEEPSSAATVRMTSPHRPDPFNGDLAFQSSVSRARAQGQGFSLSAPPCELAYLAPAHPRRRGHRRGESGLSIATMSSLGELIERRVADDYTNHFEVNFTEHLNSGSATPNDSVNVGPAAHDAGCEAPLIRDTPASGRPIEQAYSLRHSKANDLPLPSIRRSSSMIRHPSKKRSIGRTDWAAQKRHSSNSSLASNNQAFRLVRPALGERMFQLGGGSQISSTDTSQREESVLSALHRELSFDSLFNEILVPDNSRLHSDIDGTLDSFLTDYEAEALNTAIIDCDSIFVSETSDVNRELLLKGLRPVSMASTSSSDDPEDTFISVARYSRRLNTPLRRPDEDCLQAEGEGDSMMSPRPTPLPGSGDRNMLNSLITRPKKPRVARHHRPVGLGRSDPPLETPGLSSPSASETSSRMSLETRFSGFSSAPGSVNESRPGHYRQKSSLGVKLHATIREEPSTATLRPTLRSTPEPQVACWDEQQDGGDGEHALKSWLAWQREAGDEYQKIRDDWVDSEESKDAVAGFIVPMTTQEIASFLVNSSESYKPLDQLPLGRIVHRRQSSLSDARLLTSPYGLPLPKPPQGNRPRTSLITKFERTNSANSSNFSFPGEDPPVSAPTPVSAVFARFVREHPPSPPPTIASLVPHTPLRPKFDAFGLQKQADKDETDGKEEKSRSRVTSNARRQALGWGRRRTSDGPTKVQEAVRKLEDRPVISKADDVVLRRKAAQKDKENVPGASRSNRKQASPSRARPTNQASGLRA